MIFLARERTPDGDWARRIRCDNWFEAELLCMTRGWTLDGEYVDEVPMEGE
jgi:hypothetical protein